MALEDAGIDWSIPTLLVAECVLVYMDADASRALVQWAAKTFTSSPATAFVLYDMIRPYDSFGKVMRANLKVGAFFFFFFCWTLSKFFGVY